MIRTGVALALLLGASVANAAGLGKLTVHSSLGQILNAEIDLVSLQQGELDNLTARVAPPEAFRDARIEYSPSLRLLRFSVEKRANGQPYLKVTSVGPINEPFVDALIEVSWAQGRIQREYPILLDPPGYAQGKTAPPVVAAAPSRAQDTPPASAPAASSSEPATAAAAPSSAPAAATGSPSAQAGLAPAASTAEAAADTYGPVERGENLSRIAAQVKPANVSLEQMLVALYRENKSAFINDNMNRLKAGQILRVPNAESVAQVEAKEASQEIRTHVADWKAYREQLASTSGDTPSRSESPAAASGTIGTAAVKPPVAPAADGPKDTLKLTRTEAPGKAGAAKGAGGSGSSQDRLNALQEEITAKDKALQEANSRVADLEKQIRDMQRLLELKGGAAAKVDPKIAAAVTPPATTTPAKPAEAPKAATPTPAPTTPAKAPETKVAEAPKPAEPPKAATPPPAKVAEAPKPTPPKVAAKAPAKKGPPQPPPKEWWEELIDDYGLLIAGGIGVLAIAGGAFAFIRRRRQQQEYGAASAMGSAFPSDLKADSTTGKPGGGLVDTGNSSFLTDFDKTGPGTIDTDEVDPVAEAEVYIAYGRDSQAEEILKEAMARDKNRPEIALKLLEIYHARKSATAFESVAKDLHDQIGDSHPMWQKAAAMGAQIDPANPLYAGAAAGGAAAVIASAPPAAAKPDVDFDLEGSSSASPAPAPDFDLNTDTSKPESGGLDFDLAPSQPMEMPVAEADAPKEEKPSFDFDLSGLEFPGTGSKPASGGTDLEVDPTRPASSAPSLELSDLSLDTPSSPSDDAGGGGEAVGTKLELAKAYLEIGDKDGAREILQEVAKEGSSSQKEEAQKLISTL